MKSADVKMRLTDVANTEQLLRIIQSIPSKKAEPFKMWLAQELGISRQALIKYESMEQELPVNVIRGLSRIFSVNYYCFIDNMWYDALFSIP
jgi:DNA-binding XRE family transcriptional regulator